MTENISISSSQDQGVKADIKIPVEMEVSPMHKSRAYQLEMLEASLRQNIIVTVSCTLLLRLPAVG